MRGMDLFSQKAKPNVEHVARVKAWVAQSMAIPPSSTVMVTELACKEPGCPPLETIIALLDGTTQRKHTLHKAVSDVTLDDVRAIATRWQGRRRRSPDSTIRHVGSCRGDANTRKVGNARPQKSTCIEATAWRVGCGIMELNPPSSK